MERLRTNGVDSTIRLDCHSSNKPSSCADDRHYRGGLSILIFRRSGARQDSGALRSCSSSSDEACRPKVRSGSISAPSAMSVARPRLPPKRTFARHHRRSQKCRVEVWRGDCRSNISVPAPFVCRCLTGSTLAPFPHLAHRTGHAELPHPALGQDFTPSPTTRRAQAGSGVRARSARKGARVDTSRPCVA